MTFDNLVHTAPFPASISTSAALNTPNTLRFTKKLGFHRDNPRIFFETQDIQRFGFVPGAKYAMLREHGPVLTLRLDLQGQRTVCKKVKAVPYTKIEVVGTKATQTTIRRERVLSVIDINSAIYMNGFKDEKEVLVTVTYGHIIITKLPKE